MAEATFYISDTGNSAIKVWSAVTGGVTSLVSSGVSSPQGVAVDRGGNVYIADTGNAAIKELPNLFIDPTARTESASGGSDVLPVVLSAAANFSGPFAPTSDQTWLTITGATNGVVGFSFSNNVGPSRTGHITLFGQTISVTQSPSGTAPQLSAVQLTNNGELQISFTNTPGATFTVLASTNLSVPLNLWTVLGVCTNIAPGQFQFTSQLTTNSPQQFYIVRSP